MVFIFEFMNSDCHQYHAGTEPIEFVHDRQSVWMYATTAKGKVLPCDGTSYNDTLMDWGFDYYRPSGFYGISATGASEMLGKKITYDKDKNSGETANIGHWQAGAERGDLYSNPIRGIIIKPVPNLVGGVKVLIRFNCSDRCVLEIQRNELRQTVLGKDEDSHWSGCIQHRLYGPPNNHLLFA